jgi:malonyl CoA-acyl carrier protein transacylase
MEMTYDTTDEDSNIKSLPLFADINVRMLQHIFTHPKGLLFATQFPQIALVIMSRAAFEDMHSKVLVQPGAAFAGHALGEFSALAAVANVLPNSSLVDIVFYRGLTTQHAAERVGQGRSNYAMCAVNPSRVGKTFDDAALREIVNTTSNGRDCLLEIVNFNVGVRPQFFLLRNY